MIGNVFYSFNEKIKGLKRELRSCNKEVFGWLDLGVEDAVKELNTLDFEMANNGVLDVDEMDRKRYLATIGRGNIVLKKRVCLDKRLRKSGFLKGISIQKNFTKR